MSKHPSPPMLATRLLRLFCNEERIEELEGDLHEVFNEFIIERGMRFSKLFYWLIVIKSFRSYALKRRKMKNSGFLTTFLMFFKHNLVITLRNLRKHRMSSLINISGLAIGISSFLAIYTIIEFELSFNTSIPGANQVYRITTKYSGSFDATNRGVANPVGSYVSETFTGVDHFANFYVYSASVQVEEGTKKFNNEEQIVIADESYFHVIEQHKVLAGSFENFDDPFRVILTEKQARKYFGTGTLSSMIDNKVTYRDSLDVFVIAIVDEPSYNTDFNFTDFISAETIENSWLKERFGDKEWGNTNSSTQLWLKRNLKTSESNILEQLARLDSYVAEQNKELDWVQNYQLQPLSDLHYNQEYRIFNSSRSPAHRPTLSILAVVAIFLLLIAVFNFINLETAQSSTKSKEVGVRKVMGSSRAHLVNRFLTETIVISFLATIIAIPMAHYGLIFFSEFVPAGAHLAYNEFRFWLFIFSLILIVGLLAGLYPSWVTSSFNPVRALMAGHTLKSGKIHGSLLRKVLISFQFLFSQLLIVGTLAIIFQISFMINKELGFEEDGVMYFYTPWYESSEKQQLMLNKVMSIPEISDVSLSGNPPVQNGYSTSTVKLKTGDEEAIFNPHQKSGDTSYIHFYGIDLLAGSNLKPIESSEEVLINETFMRDLGFTVPAEVIGQNLDNSSRNIIVVGVMEDFHFRSMHHPIEPLYLKYSESNRCIAIKTNGNEQMEGAIDKLTEGWHEIYDDIPLTIRFMDETVESFYASERKASKLTTLATSIAILISCLGLIGLISFTVIQKSKELGIRKVLGASLMQLGFILSRQFILLILISFAISTPIAYFVVNEWMADFAYKTKIEWWVYGLGGLASMLIAMASIFTKIWNASTANPIDSLRYE